MFANFPLRIYVLFNALHLKRRFKSSSISNAHIFASREDRNERFALHGIFWLMVRMFAFALEHRQKVYKHTGLVVATTCTVIMEPVSFFVYGKTAFLYL